MPRARPDYQRPSLCTMRACPPLRSPRKSDFERGHRRRAHRRRCRWSASARRRTPISATSRARRSSGRRSTRSRTATSPRTSLLAKKPADAAVAQQKRRRRASPSTRSGSSGRSPAAWWSARCSLVFGGQALSHQINGGDVRPCNMDFQGRLLRGGPLDARACCARRCWLAFGALARGGLQRYHYYDIDVIASTSGHAGQQLPGGSSAACTVVTVRSQRRATSPTPTCPNRTACRRRTRTPPRGPSSTRPSPTRDSSPSRSKAYNDVDHPGTARSARAKTSRRRQHDHERRRSHVTKTVPAAVASDRRAAASPLAALARPSRRSGRRRRARLPGTGAGAA